MVLRAEDIMDTSFVTVDGESDALSCAQTMVERRKGYAVVTRGGPTKMAGIVTEWDFLQRIVAPGVDAARTRVLDIATSEVHACAPETPTDEVVTRMASLGIRRMVVQKGEEVVGVITARNVLTIFRQYVDRLSSEIAGYQSNQTPLG
jgi:signal-transduction protein with cAMP-binding, CBS, and nucleotidyltransferase domain